MKRKLRPSRRAAYFLPLLLLLSFSAPRAARGQSERALAVTLQDTDPARTSAAIDAIAERKDRSAVQALGNFIAQGQPDALTDHALSALGRMRSPEALPILTQLTHHRRAAARERSYAALSVIPDARADAVLGQGLRDSDSAVRVVCARALGERNARGQLEPLFRAFERGVPEAALAIGRVADAPAIERLHGYLGHASLPPMLSAYEALLLRADVGEAEKLDIIARLGEVATPSVKGFLQRLAAGNHNWSAQLPVLRAMADTAARIKAPGTPSGKQP